ncbi:MAG TPA: cupin domain-containing protein [Bacteroidales bacterium]
MSKFISLILSLSIVSFGINNQGTVNKESSGGNTQLGLKQIIEACATAFKEKIDSSYREKVCISLEDGSEKYTLIVGPNKQITVYEGNDSTASIYYKAKADLYNKFYYGEMAPATAVVQARSSDPIPLNYSFGKHVSFNADFLNRFLFFTQHFFNRDIHDKLILREESSRLVHGGYGIPIFYQKDNEIGVRSAWYQINKGQCVNEGGNSNPFPQYIIIIGGTAKAIIGSDTLVIRKGEAYFIAPNQRHTFWNVNEEPCQAIWIAWGKGA